MTVEDVILALLAELQNVGILPSKTKALKLLYLIDIEQFRSTGQTLTGWGWIFHRFGPWTPEYDGVLNRLQDAALIEVQVVGIDREAWLLKTLHPERDLQSLPDVTTQFSIDRVLRRWAKLDLRRILDYVYFCTEPMQGAQRGQALSFDAVLRGRYIPYRRQASTATPHRLADMRAVLRSALARPPTVPDGRYRPPRYDVDAEAALAALEDEE